MDLFGVDPLDLSPKLNATASKVIANEIYCDPHQPGVDAALAAKCLAALVSVPEAVLREGFCNIHIAHRRKQEPQHTRPVLLHDTIEVFEFHDRVFHAQCNQP